MKKLSRLSSEDEQRRTINSLVQRVQELERVQELLVALLVELGAVDADELAVRIANVLAPVRAVPGVRTQSSAPREVVPSEGGRGAPYREYAVDLAARVIPCDSCGEPMAAEQTLYDDSGGNVCEDCFNAARLGR